MNKDQVAGEVKKVGGELREKVANVTGDTKGKFEGIKDQATGSAQKAFGDVKQAANDTAEAAKKKASNS